MLQPSGSSNQTRSMKPSLQLQIGQQLTMTPQLQQAIRLLQLSTLDLRLEIQQAVETNPLLEMEEGAEDFSADDGEYDADADLDVERSDALEDLVDGPVETDSDWDDLYVGQSSPGGESEDADAWQQRHANPDTLISHMEWQLNLTPMSDRDRVIAQIIIEALDERGFVTVPLEDLVTIGGTQGTGTMVTHKQSVNYTEANQAANPKAPKIGVAILSEGEGYTATWFTNMVSGVYPSNLAKRVQMTEMPQLVAAMHSLVGLAAVFVGYNAHIELGRVMAMDDAARVGLEGFAALIAKTAIVYGALFYCCWQISRMISGAGDEPAAVPAQAAATEAGRTEPARSKPLDQLAEKPRLRSRRDELLK